MASMSRWLMSWLLLGVTLPLPLLGLRPRLHPGLRVARRLGADLRPGLLLMAPLILLARLDLGRTAVLEFLGRRLAADLRCCGSRLLADLLCVCPVGLLLIAFRL